MRTLPINTDINVPTPANSRIAMKSSGMTEKSTKEKLTRSNVVSRMVSKKASDLVVNVLTSS